VKTKNIYFLIYLLTSFSILLSCNSCDKEENVNPENNQHNFYFGADMSSVNMIEDAGGVYSYNNETVDPFELMNRKGCNLIRVRLFHTPENEDGYTKWYMPGTDYCGLKDVAKTIKRAKDLGMEVCLDFHYSDIWADPAHQVIPKAWEGLELSTMKDSLYNYTLNVLNVLNAKNLVPEMVQIGNEIDPGLLLPVGDNMDAVAVLLNQGIKAVRDFSGSSDIKPKIIIHYSDNANTIWRAEQLEKAGITDYDILGISYYDQWAKINLDELTSVLLQFNQQFSKDIMVVETAYQWTNTDSKGYERKQIQFNGYDVSPSAQYNYLKDLTQHVINGGAIGLIYWEPAWIPSSAGNNWDVNTLFDFNGAALPAVNYMVHEYSYPK
jgi:arabinogalactan endo-1,4-beta-galactosidase